MRHFGLDWQLLMPGNAKGWPHKLAMHGVMKPQHSPVTFSNSLFRLYFSSIFWNTRAMSDKSRLFECMIVWIAWKKCCRQRLAEKLRDFASAVGGVQRFFSKRPRAAADASSSLETTEKKKGCHIGKTHYVDTGPHIINRVWRNYCSVIPLTTRGNSLIAPTTSSWSSNAKNRRYFHTYFSY